MARGAVGRGDLVRTFRWIAIGLGVVIAVNLLTLVLGSFFGDPGGPRSSSFATAPEGVAAFASLLQATGKDVVQARDELADAALDPSGETLVVLDPEALSAGDLSALKSFVEAGGRLLAGGETPSWIGQVVDDAPQWNPAGPPDVPGPSTFPGVGRVVTEGAGSWDGTGGGSAVFGPGPAPLAVEESAGGGTVLLLADPSPLQNQLLDEADNAAFALALVGPSDRVVFAESLHGYGRGTGLGALPSRWRWSLALLALAAGAWIWAKGRRLGPPEDARRPLPPPRTVYVEALAATLARTERRKRGS
jgi:hypothetical protein